MDTLCEINMSTFDAHMLTLGVRMLPFGFNLPANRNPLTKHNESAGDAIPAEAGQRTDARPG